MNEIEELAAPDDATHIPGDLQPSISEPKRQPIDKLCQSLARAQGAIKNAQKDAQNPHFRSDYSTLSAIRDVVREPLAENDLAILQVAESGDNQVSLETTLLHGSGQTLYCGKLIATCDCSNPQKLGSVLTYFRRYSILAVTGCAPTDDPSDDDGNAAAGMRDRITDAAFNGLIQTFAEHFADELEGLDRPAQQEKFNAWCLGIIGEQVNYRAIDVWNQEWYAKASGAIAQHKATTAVVGKKPAKKTRKKPAKKAPPKEEQDTVDSDDASDAEALQHEGAEPAADTANEILDNDVPDDDDFDPFA